MRFTNSLNDDECLVYGKAKLEGPETGPEVDDDDEAAEDDFEKLDMHTTMEHLTFSQFIKVLLEAEDICGYEFTERSHFADLTGGSFGRTAFFAASAAEFGNITSFEPDESSAAEARSVWNSVKMRVKNMRSFKGAQGEDRKGGNLKMNFNVAQWSNDRHVDEMSQYDCMLLNISGLESRERITDEDDLTEDDYLQAFAPRLSLAKEGCILLLISSKKKGTLPGYTCESTASLPKSNSITIQTLIRNSG